MPNIYNVVSSKRGGWDVKGTDAERSIKRFTMKSKAIAFAKKVSENQAAELKVHNEDGKITQSISYGNDSLPSKDKR